MVVVKSSLLPLVIYQMQVVMWVKGSSLPRRHVQVYLHTVFWIRCIQRRGDGKNCAGGEVGEPRNLFPRLGVGWGFAPGDAWNLPSEGTGVGSWLVSPAEGVSALALAHFNQLHACLDMDRHVFTIAPSAPSTPPPPPSSPPLPHTHTTNQPTNQPTTQPNTMRGASVANELKPDRGSGWCGTLKVWWLIAVGRAFSPSLRGRLRLLTVCVRWLNPRHCHRCRS